jgi:hypothetical protein
MLDPRRKCASELRPASVGPVVAGGGPSMGYDSAMEARPDEVYLNRRLGRWFALTREDPFNRATSGP